jgi:hypothetical protein
MVTVRATIPKKAEIKIKFLSQTRLCDVAHLIENDFQLK